MTEKVILKKDRLLETQIKLQSRFIRKIRVLYFKNTNKTNYKDEIINSFYQ